MKKRVKKTIRKNRKRATRQQSLGRFLKFSFLTLFLAALAFGLHFLFYESEYFKLESLQMPAKLQLLTADKLKPLIQVQRGQNIFKINVQAIADRIQTLDEVKQVKVQRRWPGTLIVQLEEHVPLLLLSDTALHYVDKDAVIFKKNLGPMDPKDYPILTGLSLQLQQEDPQKFEMLLEKSIALLEIYQRRDFDQRLPLSEIHFNENKGFILYPEKKKYSIKIGYNQFSRKINKLFLAVERLKKTKTRIGSIDLNYTGKILITL